ncbi:MAG: hypothetical protein ACOWWR_17075 [Eubacteriales bacterium]
MLNLSLQLKGQGNGEIPYFGKVLRIVGSLEFPRDDNLEVIHIGTTFSLVSDRTFFINESKKRIMESSFGLKIHQGIFIEEVYPEQNK